MKKEIFWMKLIFKTKEQEPDFTRAFIKILSVFSTGGIPIWPSTQQIKEGMPKNV